MSEPLHNNFTALIARMDAVAAPVVDWEALSERFQGTVGRTFWYDVSRVVPVGGEGDFMLVHVYAPRSNEDHLHVEIANGTVEETLSCRVPPETTDGRFQTHTVYMTYPDWRTLMVDLMDSAWEDGV